MLIILTLIPSVLSRCGFSVHCEGQNCNPFDVDTDPAVGRVDMCPTLDNTLICCNADQVSQLQANFQAIDATFGSQGGGCDICSSNLKKFWCEYTCSPRQRDFLTTNGFTEMKDPLNEDITLIVQLVNIRIQSAVACSIWESCKRTQFAAQVSAMKTPGGFFNFQGEQAVGQAKQYITVEFSEDADSTIAFNKIDQCDKVYQPGEDGKTVTDDGFEILEKCSCNNCDLTCDSTVFVYQPTGILEGFNTKLVLACWGGVVFFSAVIIVVRRQMSQKKKDLLIEPI